MYKPKWVNKNKGEQNKMKFATIMREAGICSRLFPECGDIDVVLYEEDGKVYKKDDVQYIKKLFDGNTDSYNKFFDFVDELNSAPSYLSINVQITPHHVIVFYKTPGAKIFPRTDSFDPLNYAD